MSFSLLALLGGRDMAHFAQLDDNSIVINVIVISNEYEANGEQYCADTFGGRWIQTSYNHNIRKQFAGIGYTYNADADVFVAPQPFPSWSLDENYDWQAPTPKPNGSFVWNEETLVWVEVLAD